MFYIICYRWKLRLQISFFILELEALNYFRVFCLFSNKIFKNLYLDNLSDPSGRAAIDVGLQPLACWDCGFEFRRRNGCYSVLLYVVGWRSLWQAVHWSRRFLSSVVCPMSVIAKPRQGRPWSGNWSNCHRKKKDLNSLFRVSNSTRLVRWRNRAWSKNISFCSMLIIIC
jgi:hypothetical protein